MKEIYLYPSRTWCAVLEDIRNMHKTHNYGLLPACIEELQYAGNRMEAALEDSKTIQEIREALAEGKKEYKALKKELEILEAKKNFLTKQEK